MEVKNQFSSDPLFSISYLKILLPSALVLGATVFGFQNCSRFETMQYDGSSLDQSSLSADSSLDKVRRLSNSEIDNSLNYILGDSSSPASKILPPDPVSPYDNDIAAHLVSTPLIEGLERLALDVSTRILANSSKRDQIFGCRGSSSNDQTCMTSLIAKLSLLFFRRPQSPEDINKWTDLAMAQSRSSNNFYDGVDFYLRMAIMHPKFIYRFENSGSNNIIDYVIAERLSFLIWGSSPDNSLLNLAAAKQLNTKSQVSDQALKMLNDDRAIKQTLKFHAQWLAYEKLGHSQTISASLKTEADALVERVIFTDNRPWSDIFTMTESFIDDTVASIYGMTLLGNASWRALPATRKGILSTGAYLSAGAKFGDTSPTQRGKFVRNRLLCQEIPPPPPTTDIDQPPRSPTSGPNCKKNRYQSHSAPNTSCYGCHTLMDPVGFGLEKYDVTGKFRSYDRNADNTDNLDCPIEGSGALVEAGNFSGPLELSNLLIQKGTMQTCMVIQYHHFAFGQKATRLDFTFADAVAKKIQTGSKFQDMVLAFVATNRFLNY